MKSLPTFFCVWVVMGFVAVGPFQFNPAPETKKAKAEQSDKNTKPSVTSALKGSEANEPKTRSDEKTRQGAPESVRVAEVPPPDKWYKAYVCATVVMAATTVGLGLIGIFGFRTANRTLEAVEGQSRSMRGQFETMQQQFELMKEQTATARIAADAAKQSAESAERSTIVLMVSQSPQLVLKPHGDIARMLLDDTTPRVEIELLNVGQTTARDLIYETWIELLPFPFQDFTGSATHFVCDIPMALSPRAGNPVINIPFQKPFLMIDIADIKSLTRYACFRMCIKYKDEFGDCWYRNFGFYVMATALGMLPKYNDGGKTENYET